MGFDRFISISSLAVRWQLWKLIEKLLLAINEIYCLSLNCSRANVRQLLGAAVADSADADTGVLGAGIGGSGAGLVAVAGLGNTLFDDRMPSEMIAG